ncbi:MAG: hypothetical protein KAJ35_04950 [Thermoplasmata archaeon]|nr:hypothetical protein [Thermoplasmata archaeon]
MTFFWSTSGSTSFFRPFRFPLFLPSRGGSLPRSVAVCASSESTEDDGWAERGASGAIGGVVGEGIAAGGTPAAGVPPPGAGWADPWTGGVETAANWLWVAAKDAAVRSSEVKAPPARGAGWDGENGGVSAGCRPCGCWGRCGGCMPARSNGRRRVVGT